MKIRVKKKDQNTELLRRERKSKEKRRKEKEKNKEKDGKKNKKYTPPKKRSNEKM